jgi:sialate O-acetylesterase
MLLTGLLVKINALANVKLPAILNDGMVLQQQSKIAVWGWASGIAFCGKDQTVVKCGLL